MADYPYLDAALTAFSFYGKTSDVKSFGTGHINDTFLVKLNSGQDDTDKYVLQRININVFKKPQQLMENALGVTGHMREKLQAQGVDAQRRVQRFLRTCSGEALFFDGEGMPWRSYHFIPDSYGYDQSPTPEAFAEAGRAFGEFLSMLSDYPAGTLYETIPDFHNTPARLAALRTAVREDALGRLAGCRPEVDFVLERAAACSLLTDLQKAGQLPIRVTHNDTKLNNVLFDNHSNRAICVIDLDTIMPGLVGNDFGDAIRFGASTAAEDERELSKVSLSLPLFEAFTGGYLEKAGGALLPAEIETLAQSARVITLECGMRFLTDHLVGDTYFRIHRPGHNLDRCRTQFKLVREMEDHMDEMQAIVAHNAQ